MAAKLSQPSNSLPVLIAGAGVAGLALGQGLRLHNIPFRIFERNAKDHASQGHRFRIREVDALQSVLPEELKSIFERTSIDAPRVEPRYVDAKLLNFPPRTLQAPGSSTPLDRSWLRMLLSIGLDDAIEYGKAFESYKISEDAVTISLGDGSKARGCLLVGTDGLRSKVRKQLQPDRKLIDVDRQISWGRTPLTPELSNSLSEELLTWNMVLDHESDVQCVIDPITWSMSVRQESDGKLPDFQDYVYFAMTSALANPRPSTAQEKAAYIKATVKDWHPDLQRLLNAASHEQTACVAIMSSKPDIETPDDLDGRVLLIGDSTHAMSPAGGAGGDTAVWAASELVKTLSRDGVTSEGLRDFKQRLAARAKEKIEHSFKGGQKFWGGKEWFEYQEVVI